MAYLTPNVYVEEVPTLAPSVAPVATAVPAFIGYTEFARDDNDNEMPGVYARRITSMPEYTLHFGGPEPSHFDVHVNEDYNITRVNRLRANGEQAGQLPTYPLWYALRLYFDNGGGPCYIISIERYAPDGTGAVDPDDFRAGLDRLQQLDEPTLIVSPDALHLDVLDFNTYNQQVLVRCANLMDRFAIFDVYDGLTNAADFRQGIGNSELKYGAAYTPYVRTTFSYSYEPAGVRLQGLVSSRHGDNGLLIVHPALAGNNPMQVQFSLVQFAIWVDGNGVRLIMEGLDSAGREPNDVITAWTFFLDAGSDPGGFHVRRMGTGNELVMGNSDNPLVQENYVHVTGEDGLRIRFDNRVARLAAPPRFRVEIRGDTDPISFRQEGDDGNILVISLPDNQQAAGVIAGAFPGTLTNNNFTIIAIGDEDEEFDTADPTPLAPASFEARLGRNGLRVVYNNEALSLPAGPMVRFAIDENATATTFAADGNDLVITLPDGGATAADIVTAWTGTTPANYSIEFLGDGSLGFEAEDAFQLHPVLAFQTDPNGIRVEYNGTQPAASVQLENAAGIGFSYDPSIPLLDISGVLSGGTPAEEIYNAWSSLPASEHHGFRFALIGDGRAMLTPGGRHVLRADPLTMTDISTGLTQLYSETIAALRRQRVTLPPSPAVAGLYARIDRSLGVWHAPAGDKASLNSVIEPAAFIDNSIQDLLNVDATSGKSINAVRSFTGKGPLVWGTRTLAGNDNEWRYINVRRLFIFIEESIQKNTAFAVFEPNDATTWLKVKAMIESFLYGLWQRGALAGPTPESAYQVEVGLGKTMDADDVTAGRLIINVKIAAVRPAEFIILRFFHLLQQA